MPVALEAPPQLPRHSYRPAYYEQISVCDNVATFGVVSYLEAELGNVFAECHVAGWDGYGAAPISTESFQVAQRFVSSLPAGIPQPSISADPDGCFTFRWSSGASKLLLVSVAPNFQVDFAAAFGESKIYGSEIFFDQFPSQLKTLLLRVFG